MDLIVIFSQISLAFIRIIGLGVGVDFLIVSKRKRFQAQVAGWSIWTLGSAFQIFSQFTSNISIIAILDFLFGITTLVGSFLVSISIIVYFRHIPVKYIFYTTLLLVALPIVILILVGLSTSVIFSIFGSFFIIAVLYGFGILEGQNFKQTVGESVKWFYGLISVGIIQMALYTYFTIIGINLSVTSLQFEDSFALTVINSFAIAVTVLTVVLLIHLENSRSILYNFQLKDKYSHDLANIMQIIASAIHLIEKESLSRNDKEDSIELLDKKLLEVLELLQEIRTLE